ncbi:MAG: DUF309 domain-containing protein [Vampirovibrionales bacterium]|nr:DUF309 domain-containing protein [Vampirovibrionales bacterium]
MTCPEPPEAFYPAVEAFNAGRFFECHEILEDALWRPERDPARRAFYQGLIQIAVGYHHAHRDNRLGARRLLARGAQRLAACGFADGYAWIDAPSFLAGVRTTLAAITGGENELNPPLRF